MSETNSKIDKEISSKDTIIDFILKETGVSNISELSVKQTYNSLCLDTLDSRFYMVILHNYKDQML